MSELRGFRVRGTVRDIAAFLSLVPKRRAALRGAVAAEPEADYIRAISDALHPERQYLVIDSVREETSSAGKATAKTYRLRPDAGRGTKALAYFRAGQYVAIATGSGRARISRPYSLSSAPSDALKGFYEITLRKTEGGLMTSRAWESWAPGAKLDASGPMGFMHHEALRDSRAIVGIAGGCGATPFRSMAREIAAGGLDASLNLVYGIADEADILFREELEGYARSMPDRFRLTYVVSGAGSCDTSGPVGNARGFVTAELLRKLADPAKDSFFLCGPAVMYSFAAVELEKLDVKRRRIRREAFGEVKDPSAFPGYPREAANRSFKVTARRGSESFALDASGSESLLVALERAGLTPNSACRSGECQVCRARLSSGRAWTAPESDGRRAADAKAGYIHPCSAFPISDVEIELPPLPFAPTLG